MAMVKTTLAILLLGALTADAAEDDFYQLTSVPFPVELKLEVSGMAALPAAAGPARRIFPVLSSDILPGVDLRGSEPDLAQIWPRASLAIV